MKNLVYTLLTALVLFSCQQGKKAVNDINNSNSNAEVSESELLRENSKRENVKNNIDDEIFAFEKMMEDDLANLQELRDVAMNIDLRKVKNQNGERVNRFQLIHLEICPKESFAILTKAQSSKENGNTYTMQKIQFGFFQVYPKDKFYLVRDAKFSTSNKTKNLTLVVEETDKPVTSEEFDVPIAWGKFNRNTYVDVHLKTIKDEEFGPCKQVYKAEFINGRACQLNVTF